MPKLSESRSATKARKRELTENVENHHPPDAKTLHFHAEQVHDFAWVASPDYLIDETEWNGVKVKALVLARHAQSKWRNLLAYEINALKFFTEKVGDYPYRTLTVAEAYNFPSGGMEYPALAMMDPAMSVPFTRALEYVTVHEVGHNWFYGALANNELDYPWLDEGFEEYFTLLYAEQTYKDGSILDLPRWASLFLDLPYRWTHEIDYRLLPPTSQELPVAQSSPRFADEREYHAIVYSKGARVLERLHDLVGDSVFNQIMRMYYAEYKFKHVTIPDFIGVASKISGKDFDAFFDQSLGRSDGVIKSNRIEAGKDEADASVKIARPLSPFAFADPGHYVIGINPSIWYNKIDKMRIGACLRSGYLMTYHSISGGFSYGIGSRKTNYHVEYSTPILSAPDIRIALKAGDDEGKRNYSVDIGNLQPENLLLSVRQSGAREFPSFRTILSLSYSDRYNGHYFDPKFYNLGKTAIVSLHGSYRQRGYEGISRIDYSLAQGLEARGARSVFSKAYLSIGQDLRLARTGEVVMNIRGSFGIMSNGAPKQEQFAVGYGVPVSTVDPIGQFIASGGGGVRGYQNDAALGSRLFAVNLEFGSERFHLGLPYIDPLLFFDVGRVYNPVPSQLANRTLYDAGIELRALDILQLSFPLWLSEPANGHVQFEFRAVARIMLPGN